MKETQGQNYKNTKGITLIALVITIITLLILAGVSISAITGSEGIMSKAKQAKEATEAAEEYEKVQMAAIQAMAESATGSVTNTNNLLKNKLQAMGLDVTTFGTSANDSWKIQGKNGQWYQISTSGQVTKPNEEPADQTIALTGITLNPTSTSINVGGTYTITGITLAPPDTTQTQVTFSIPQADSAIATVNASTGVITAGNTAGTTTVTVSGANGVTATFTVTVNPPPTVAEVTTIAQAKTQNAVAVNTGITTLKDDNNKDVKIPAKFHIASDSATVVADGIVIEDASGNQFVWIPVDNISSYTRTAFKGENITSTYTESMPSDEYDSVDANKGYYIGRYEAGDSTKTTGSGSSLRASGASTSNAVAIKKGYAPYNYISRTNAITRAEAMDSEQGYSATTKLCSSYAWDTAINFIQSKGGDLATYGSSSPQGNYSNVSAFSYTDITGTEQNKVPNAVIPTGQTTVVCNIYDMGGNVYEWTTETSSDTSFPCSRRGGDCSSDYGSRPAGYRGNTNDRAGEYFGFRVTLFM